MKSKIKLCGVKTYAFHGCMDAEANIGAYYKTDVIMDVDVVDAAKNDDLDKTVNYAIVNDIILSQMAIRSHLIENVCLRILKEVKKAYPQVEHIKVKVTKIAPPVSGSAEGATVELSE
ncbi:MAG: dihydroneopterin aldolase [Flavobacteriales bacterium]|nr:dihydroneopterin aldolase [Flavobacteriales bacterium]